MSAVSKMVQSIKVNINFGGGNGSNAGNEDNAGNNKGLKDINTQLSYQPDNKSETVAYKNCKCGHHQNYHT